MRPTQQALYSRGWGNILCHQFIATKIRNLINLGKRAIFLGGLIV